MKRNCKICGKEFEIFGNLLMQKKTCSYECWRKNNYAISTARRREKTEKICKDCGEKFVAMKHHLGTGRCSKCIYNRYRKARVGKNNPNFRNGVYTHKNLQNRKNSRAYKHLNECRRYRKEFLENNGYLYCEVCGVSANATMRFEVHHIYFASLYPRHKNLHNNRNLVLVCIECHRAFHAGKQYEREFRRLEKERGLKELFAKSV